MAKFLYTVTIYRADDTKVHSAERVNKVSALEHARELLVEFDKVTITKERTK